VQRYDRSTLVFDGADSALGGATLELVSLGLDPLYANDEAELVLLAREHRDRIAALVVPGTLPLERLDAIRERVTPLLPGGNAAIVVVAPPRQRAVLAALRGRGIRWVVFAPYEASELRFAVAAALATGDVLEPRSGLRVPIRLPVSVCHAGSTRTGEITNLSVGGAYVALAQPPGLGARVSLGFPIGERMLSVSASVAHRGDGPRPGSSGDPGMGVAFSAVGLLEAQLIEGFVRERIESFRL
jgi:PilZ domain